MIYMNNVALLILSLVTALSVSASLVTKQISYDHEGVQLTGVLVYNEAKTDTGLLPGVLVIHEWWGLNQFAVEQAQKFADLGYVAFALDMYGSGVNTADANEARDLAMQFYGQPLMAERARAGLDELLDTGLVDEDRVAVAGYCFGGSTAMALAYSGAPLAGMVSFHGGPIPASAETAAKNNAKFLICHGGDDPMVPKEKLDAFLLSLEEGEIDYQFITYQGAQHAFTNKSANKFALMNQLKGVKYHGVAARRSWEHMRVFLDEVFR